MRMMSFALTESQLLDGSKTVTRRVGWCDLKPGTHLLAVRKAMGLKAGEKVQALCEIEVVSVRRERLDAIDRADCIAEGFPDLAPDKLCEMFCKHHAVAERSPVTDVATWTTHIRETRRAMRPDDEVTRIEFRVVPASVRVAVQERLIA